MIQLRWLKAGDEPIVAEVVRNAYTGRVHYDYRDADGYGLLAELNGAPVGVVLFWLGKPETWIRELAVCTEHRGSLVAGQLMKAVGQLAQAYGSRALAGNVSSEDFVGMYSRTGAALHPKILARFWLRDPKVQRFLTPPQSEAPTGPVVDAHRPTAEATAQ